MNTKELTANILTNLNREWTELVKKKHGKTREILLGDLIEAILIAKTGIGSCSILNISSQTFNRSIKKAFPDVKLTGGGDNWKHYLLTVSDYKYCFECSSVRLKTDFWSDTHNTDGLDARCKFCKKVLQQHNKERWVAYANKHRAAKLQRTPNWADLEVIEEIYLNCPEGYEVDHIVPLQGENVSGLHVEYNLQYLTKSENCSKGNKF